MIWILALVILGTVATIAIGAWLHLHPPAEGARVAPRLRGAIAASAALVATGAGAVVVTGTRAALAQEPGAEAVREISVGMGLALIGIGLPTALACVGAAIAVGSVGAAALAVIAEKPETFGRTLVFMGLAEGIAIYGLVVTILMLDKV